VNTYLLICEQSEGCDYTIGCGIRVERFRAKDLEAALVKALKKFGGSHLGEYDLTEIHTAKLIEVSGSLHIDLDTMREEFLQKAGKEAVKAREVDELREFERLKKKYQ